MGKATFEVTNELKFKIPGKQKLITSRWYESETQNNIHDLNGHPGKRSKGGEN